MGMSSTGIDLPSSSARITSCPLRYATSLHAMMPRAISMAGRFMAAGSICTPRVWPAIATRTKMVLSGVAAVNDWSAKAYRRRVDLFLVAESLRDGAQVLCGCPVGGLVLGERRIAALHNVVGRRLELMHDRPVRRNRREDLGRRPAGHR